MNVLAKKYVVRIFAPEDADLDKIEDALYELSVGGEIRELVRLLFESREALEDVTFTVDTED